MGPRLNLLALEGMAADPADVERLAEAGWIIDTEPGHAVFRHALLREVIYGQIPWTRRRQWHADCAARLEAMGGAAELLAEHWLAAREPDARAPRAVADGRAGVAAACLCRCRRTGSARARPLAGGLDEELRLQTLERLGECAQFAGQHDGAARAWLELCERAQRTGLTAWTGPARRRLALLHAHRSADFERSIVEREHAAEAFLADGRPIDAARSSTPPPATATGATSCSVRSP